VFWRVTGGSGHVARETTLTDAAGTAVGDWTLGADLTRPQTLEIRVGDRVVAIQAVAGLPNDARLRRTSEEVAPDTIGGLHPSPLRVHVMMPDGRPVFGAAVEFTVQRGGGQVLQPVVLTDSVGDALTGWQFGESVGPQEVIATVRTEGQQASLTKQFTGFATAGQPTSIQAVVDTIRFDALGDTLLPSVLMYDRLGNQTDAPVTWTSLSPAILNGLGPLGLASTGNGLTHAVASSGSASLTLPVIVSQVPVALRQEADSAALHWLGSSTRLRATAVDRLGSAVAGASPSWQSLEPALATVDQTGLVRAGAVGVARIVAEFQNLADTVTVVIDQRPAAVAVIGVSDTMNLDERLSPVATVYDSGGTLIPGAAVQVTALDPAVVTVGAGGELQAALPGRTSVSFRAGSVAAIRDVVVEGVAVLVSGQRAPTVGVISGLAPFTITNGRVRMSWSTAMWEIASVEMDVRLGTTWHPASARGNGDWVYVASTIRTMPTRVEIVESTVDRVAVQMRFDDHWFLPSLALFPDSLGLTDQPYPFVRTIWLRKADNGYYSWVDLLDDLQLKIVEHETGFGGIWGPATIRTNRVEIRTDTLSRTITYNGNPVLLDTSVSVDAAEFVLDGDPVRRVLVPLPEAPFITPVFPGWGYGSVYRYAGPSRSFGVYMYASVVGAGPLAAEICEAAWTNAPFPLHPVSAAEFAACGPPDS